MQWGGGGHIIDIVILSFVFIGLSATAEKPTCSLHSGIPFLNFPRENWKVNRNVGIIKEK